MSISDEFDHELRLRFRNHHYQWSRGKERSCQWMLQRIDAGRMVDIGGTVWLLQKLTQKGLVCTYYDAYPPYTTGNVDFDIVTGDLHEVADRLPRKTFDFVSSRHTLEHALNPLLVLWQINLLLKESGKALIIVPHHRPFWVWFYTHFNCLPLENWRMLFYRAGFEIEEEATGQWDDEQTSPWFLEHRFALRVATRSIRLDNP